MSRPDALSIPVHHLRTLAGILEEGLLTIAVEICVLTWIAQGAAIYAVVEGGEEVHLSKSIPSFGGRLEVKGPELRFGDFG